MKTRLLALAIGVGALAVVTGALAYTGGKGITGSPHDFSSPVTTNPATGVTSGGTNLLQWLTAAGAVTTSYTAGLAPNCVPAGTLNAAAVVTSTCASGWQGAVRIQVGLCTRCHTAHQAKSQTLLWNHTLNPVMYSWNVTSTTAGTIYPTFKGDTYTGPTPKCLSCHDGLMSSTDGMWFNKAYNQGVPPTSCPTPGMSHDVANGCTGSMVGTHPVAMPYPLNGAVNTYNSTTNGAIVLGSGWIADPSATNNIMLYNDATGQVVRGSTAGRTGIECGSCHDVHNGPRVPDTSATQSSPLLLTGFNTGSATGSGGYICNQCHVK